MVWDKDKRLLFIHIPKTGGSSVEYSMNCLENKEKGWKIVNNKAIQHSKWNYYKIKEPKVSLEKNKYWTIFSIVRNPYAKLVSEFFFLKKINLENISYNNHYFKNINEMSLNNFIDYTEYIVKYKLYHLSLYHDHFIPQSDFIFDNNEKLKVNKLFYFYQLANGDVLKFLKKFGIKKFENKNFNEIKKNISLSINQKKRIRQIYKKDFKLLFNN